MDYRYNLSKHNGDVIDPSEYTVAYANNIKAGKADVEVTFKGSQFEGVKTLAFTIKKAANPLTVKKGLKKGTYKVKVKVKAKGNANYKSVVRTLTFTVKVIYKQK